MHTESDLISLALRLVETPSNTGEEQAVLELLETIATADGFCVSRFPVDDNRWNLLVHSGVHPDLLFSTHVDTVPGGPCAKLEGDRICGRGSCDAKGIAAAFYCALQELPKAVQKRTGLLLVVGEETSSDGAKSIAKQLPKVKFIVNGEPTELKWVKAQRGVISFSLASVGIPAHSGYPQFGKSAIHNLLDAIQLIRNTEWPSDSILGETSINIGTLVGGSAANVLAPSAKADIMMRLVTPHRFIEPKLLSILGSEVSIKIHSQSDPQLLDTPENEPTIVVGFGSDIAHLRPLGTPLMMGPGSIHNAHTDHEHVLCADLLAAKNSYIKTAIKLLTKPKEVIE